MSTSHLQTKQYVWPRRKADRFAFLEHCRTVCTSIHIDIKRDGSWKRELIDMTWEQAIEIMKKDRRCHFAAFNRSDPWDGEYFDIGSCTMTSQEDDYFIFMRVKPEDLPDEFFIKMGFSIKFFPKS